MPHYQKRGRYYEYRRRVPKKYSRWDKRADVRHSLKTDSEAIALKKSQAIDEELERYWEALKKGESQVAIDRYEAAIEIAASYGLQYKSAHDISLGSIEDIVNRMLTTKEQGGFENKSIRTALAGGIDKPDMHLDEALDKYFSISKDQQRGKNEDQLRRWKNPKKKAFKNLKSVIGDKLFLEITWQDALAFRDYWSDRLDDEALTANSANKDFTHIRTVYKKVFDELRIKQQTPFDGISFKDDGISNRKHFTVEHITKILLNLENLNGLNYEAKWTLFAMADTGAGPNELCGLKEEDIVLDADIPHIHIQPNEIRRLKNKHRERLIPLVGASLLAFKHMPKGYDRYKGKNTQLSSVLNKYLRENQLFPSPEHSLYSLRHSFEERMLTAKDENGNPAPIDARYRAGLMGHKYDRPAYGAGGELSDKRDQLLRIALTV
jgi:integrase